MGGEIGAGATLAGTLLGRELTVMGWIANGFGVCVLLVIVLFVASLWHENRKPVTHLVFLPPALPAASDCPCCTATPFTVNDCTCREPCGELWCQAADLDVPGWLKESGGRG